MQKQDISQRAFAATISEHSQTLNAVITGRRNLTAEIAVKIELALGYEEGFLLMLQDFHSIAEYKNQLAAALVSGVPNVRRTLFWETNFDAFDWDLYKGADIQRIMAHGDEADKSEIARF